MAESPLDILLFGDQTGDYTAIFYTLLQHVDDVYLKAFLDKIYLTLREEVSQQPLSIREQLPGFTSIRDLVARYVEPDIAKSNAIESALTCISQLACFFFYQSTKIEAYPSPTRTRIVASCIGLLAAAAVSSSENLTELLVVASEVVRVAFRLGIIVSEAAAEIEQSTTKAPSWSAIVPNLNADAGKEILDSFHGSKGIPPSNHGYISAISPNSLTISGPNNILDRIFQSPEGKDLKPTRISILGPYHAQHLFDSYDLARLYSQSSLRIFESRHLHIPLSSTSSPSWHVAASLRQLIDDIARDILANTLRWDHVLDNVASEVRKVGNSQCNVIRLGPSSAGQSLVSALRQNKEMQVSSNDQFTNGPSIPEDDQGPSNQPKIAICGLSGRYPDATDPAAFWELLEKGLDLHREIPKDRFDVKTHVDADGRRTNTSHTSFGCFIKEPGLFDPKFFNLSPREATQTDPMQRLALVTAYEALEMAGYVENRTPSTRLDRIATFYGQTSDDWREIQAAQKVDTYFIPGGVRAFAPGRINYFFNFSGPSFSIDTACSSSLAAIQLACTSLWAHDCDTALAGGMNVLTNPDIFSGLSRGQFLSKKGPCATFDDKADGYCRADGIGSVVLKRLEDAKADKDPILAVILGAATNHSAEAVSITHPHAGAQEYLYKSVLNRAGIDPHDVSYVEMHGTGTQAGDATEMRSVTNVFAPPHRRRRPDQRLYLGAVKANAGHAEAASGTTSLTKVLMMMQKDIIPPHCGIKGEINRTFPKDLEERNVHIPFGSPKTWKRQNGAKRRVFLNNFSAAGGNTALLLEDGPIKSPIEDKDKRTCHTVAVTARTKGSLKKNVENLISYLEQHPETKLSSLSYTTTSRRIQFNFRMTVAGSTVDAVKQALKSSMSRDVEQIPKIPRKISLMFTGQGSHYVGMAKQLFNTSPQFGSDIKRFDKIATLQGFSSIMPLVDGSITDIATLSPQVVQLGATCVQMALFRLYQSWGIQPTVVVGHSLGEYAALYTAGVLSITDTVYLVGKRATLLQDKCSAGSHSMLAIKASASSVSRFLQSSACEIACINGPEETVISGTNLNIDMLADELKENGFKVTKLSIPFAFHSAQVESILDDFENATRGVTFNAPSVPVISPLLNDVIKEDGTFGPSYLRNHCRKTVNFLGGMEAAKHAKLVAEKSLWVEIGSHPICSSMVKSTLGPSTQTIPSLRRNEDDWKTIAESLCVLNDAGLSIDWNQYHRGFESSSELLQLPTYAWDNQNYWIEYTNNWTLHKGNPEIAAEIPDPNAHFSAASVHRIVEIDVNAEKPFIVVESDLTEPLLKEVIEGHEVNGFGLCPPSLYCDMAMTVAKHFHSQMNLDVSRVGLNAASMTVEKPLIVKNNGPQLFRIAGVFEKTKNCVNFDFYSVNADGKKTVTHATCGVKYENSEEWVAGWQRNKYMVQRSIESLRKGIEEGSNDLIKRGMAYKLFGGLIHYGHKYRGMEEVIFSNAQLEATACVSFQTEGRDAEFLCSPYRTDSVAHISGFIMLANDQADPSKEVYVSHGWDNYRVAQPLAVEKKYRSYVKMQYESAKRVVGDVWVFDGEEVVAVVEGLRFHALPRQLMDSLLVAAGGKAPPPTPTATISARSAKLNTAPPPKPEAGSTKAQPPAKVPLPSKLASSGVTARALGIIAEEVGVPVADLKDETSFADMGVDSLLSLNITGKFKEQLDVDIASTSFVDYPTVKDLKGFFAQHEGPEDTPAEPVDAAGATSSDATSEPTSTPLSSSALDEVSSQPSSVSGEEPSQPLKTGGGDTNTLIQSTVAEELGIQVEELDDSSDLASMGMDSLMSLSVLGKLRESSGVDLPSDFFAQNTTFGHIEKAVGVKSGQGQKKAAQEDVKFKPTQQASSVAEPANEEPHTENTSEEPVTKAREDDSVSTPDVKETSNSPPAATSVLLQGNPKTATKTLFLFPDGSGSATSYSLIPPISATLAIYGLTSPFIHNPAAFTTSIPDLTALYITELLRRQPSGPYCLGGWSAGGVCAYEAVRQLQGMGHTVECLILLDSPCPSDLDVLPPHLHRWFDEMGILGPNGRNKGDTAPDWLIPHFDAAVRSLSAYKPPKLDETAQMMPRTYALWAKDGVCKFPTDPRPPELRTKREGRLVKWPRSMRWLLENREGEQLQRNGWERYLGGECVMETSVVKGANHFTLMREEHVQRVAEFIGEMME